MTDPARFVGDIPRHYDRGLGPILFDHYARDIAQRAALRAPRAVLEIAAGTGVVTRRLREVLHPQATLAATDLNAPMLEVAQDKFEPGEIEFSVADALALPFSDGAFDCLVCQFGHMFFPDRDAAHREAWRVLAPHGRYLFSVWDAPRYNPFSRIGLEAAAQFFPDDPPKFLEKPFSCPQIDPVKESLIAAGFTHIAVYVLPHLQEIPDVPAFARGLVFGSPLIEEIRARGGVEPEAVVERLAERFTEEFGSPARMPLQAILFDSVRG
jgi:ubiquinone/menaquinone biosynthesis C-methylase UbiE